MSKKELAYQEYAAGMGIQAVADKVGVARRTMEKYIQEWRETGTPLPHLTYGRLQAMIAEQEAVSDQGFDRLLRLMSVAARYLPKDDSEKSAQSAAPTVIYVTPVERSQD